MVHPGLQLFVERHQPVIILGNLCDQTGHDVVPTVSGAEIAQHRRVSGVPQLPPDVNLPGEVGGYQEIGQRIGKVAAIGRHDLAKVGSQRRVGAEFIPARAGPERDEGKVRPAPPQNLVVGDRDVFGQDLSSWLPTSAWSIRLVSRGSLKNSVVPT